jgi:hypothetical protein
MKKTLIVLCSAIALVGCNQNRGGLGSDKNRDTGYGSSRSTARDTNTTTLNTPSTTIVTTTNSTLPAPQPATPAPQNDYGTPPKN